MRRVRCAIALLQMNFVMFPLALAPLGETIVQQWDPPMVLFGKLLAIAVLVLLNGNGQ